jgi:uncharacterized membrane protein YkvA (DUF1232 family)
MRHRSHHPMVRLAGTVARLPRYLKLTHELVRDPSIPATSKAVLAAGYGYAALPFDLIPGIIPVAGQLDDLAAVLLALRHAVNTCPDAAEGHLARAGLSQTALDADLKTVREAGMWLARKTAVLGLRAVLAPLHAFSSRNRSHRASPARTRTALPNT